MMKHLGIVGAGTMGTGIAQLAASLKIDVLLYDINETILRRALETIKANLRIPVSIGKMAPEEFTAIVDCIHTRTNLPDIGHCDIIIESIIEDLRVKKDLFKHLDANTRTSTVLASTTSSLSITSIAALTRNPERVVGMHFFHPVDGTALVEVIKGYKTNNETIQRAVDFIKLINKSSIIVKDSPGFIVTRISHPFFSEALRLLSENVATAEQIDRIVKSIGGFTIGPFESLDQMGLDTYLATAESLHEQMYGESRFRPHPILKQMVEAELLGKKSGKGFFTYKEK